MGEVESDMEPLERIAQIGKDVERAALLASDALRYEFAQGTKLWRVAKPLADEISSAGREITGPECDLVTMVEELCKEGYR